MFLRYSLIPWKTSFNFIELDIQIFSIRLIIPISPFHLWFGIYPSSCHIAPFQFMHLSNILLTWHRNHIWQNTKNNYIINHLIPALQEYLLLITSILHGGRGESVCHFLQKWPNSLSGFDAAMRRIMLFQQC